MQGCKTCCTNIWMVVTWDGGNGLKNQAHHFLFLNSFFSQPIFCREKHLCLIPLHLLHMSWLLLHCLAYLYLSAACLCFSLVRGIFLAASTQLIFRLFVVQLQLLWTPSKLQKQLQECAVKWFALSSVPCCFTQRQKSSKAGRQYCRGMSLKA